MTRFKEGRRINRAVENGDRKELEWALGYCNMRLKIAPSKEHVKHWEQMKRKIQRELEE